MSRKTFHHLTVGEYTVAERCVLADDGISIKVVEQFPRSIVKENDPKAKTVKVTIDGSGTKIASISKQSGFEWGKDVADDGGCWRLAPALARTKGSQVHLADSIVDLPTTLTMARNYFVYPGQPLVIAACILREYHNPESAMVPCIQEGKPQVWCHAEGNRNLPGSGGQTTKAAEALFAYRQHGSIDALISELHRRWKDQFSDNDKTFVSGQALAERLEPDLRKALKGWL